MERDSKRKAGAAGSPDGEERTPKRPRYSNHGDDGFETVDTTTEAGLKFMECLKSAKDKTGRTIATEFLTLPDPSILPQYYQEVKLPIAIDTLEQKIKNRQYSTLAALESDFKRMVVNAKSFNDKKSPIYEDAERMRKTASNWMVKHNPAYRDKTYSAIATPVPGEAVSSIVNGVTPMKIHQPVPSPTVAAERPRRISAPSQPAAAPPPPSRSRKSETRDPVEQRPPGLRSFKGKSFQEAQAQIMDEVIHYTEPESGLEIFTPFVNLPSRQLLDYYKLIKKPVSLRSVEKRVFGIHGRHERTDETDFKSWDALEDEVSYIWKNAREYNEDGSEIYNLAGEFEGVFKKRLAEAKSKVEQPPQQSLKIKVSGAAPKPSIKIHLRGHRDSPGPQSGQGTPRQGSGTPSVLVDAAALQRQQQHVQAGMNGQMRRLSSSTASTPNPALNPPDRKATASPVVNGVKPELQPGQSPSLHAIRPASTASDRTSAPLQTPNLAASAMPPPSSAARPVSGSPRPQSQPSHPPHHNPVVTPQSLGNSSGFEKKPRTNANARHALLSSLTISSHPSLGVKNPFAIRIPASRETTHQSVAIPNPLPATHYWFQITPHIPVALTVRPYRVFVLVNGTKVYEAARHGSLSDKEKDKSRPVFEAKLERGLVNRIEVEILAGPAQTTGLATRNAGVNRQVEKDQVEQEKLTAFMRVLAQ